MTATEATGSGAVTADTRSVDPREAAACAEQTDLPDQVPVVNGSHHSREKAEYSYSISEKADHNQPHKTVAVLHPRTKEGFLHIFGWMGVPMVVIFLLSAMWTFMLAAIQQIPTEIANWLMETTDLDDGNFWLLPKPAPVLSVSAIVILVLLGAGYLSLVVLMAFPDKLLASRWHHPQRHEPVKLVVRLESVPTMKSSTTTESSVHHRHDSSSVFPKVDPIDLDAAVVKGAKKVAQREPRTLAGLSWERLKYEATSPNGLLHQYYNPVLDLPKLVFQTVTLLTYLRNGFPLAIICIYSCALFINWMISAYRYKRERPDPHFIISRVFYSFDLFFAVFAPLEVLVYAFYTFHFDRAVFATRAATLNPGIFDRTARMFADPTQISMFRIAFHYLQFTTTGSLLIKCALNVLSLFKWWRTIIHLIDYARAVPTPRESAALGSFERKVLAKIRRRKHIQNVLIAGTFLCAGCAVFIHSIVAIVSTQSICKLRTQCKVPSYQWNVGEEHCSCIVFVDRETELKTIAEWEDPPDTTANLAELAATGHLRIIQIVNRQLPTLPDALRHCHNLEQIILLYTKTLAVPDWAKDFKRLEYFHIEGDLTAKQLTYLPRDLFADMPHLLFVHLGCLLALPYVPAVDKLHELRYLVMAMLHSITTIPDLSSLHKLERLTIVNSLQVYSLPPLHELRNLKAFVLGFRNPICCNGFITGTCDLNNFSCRNRTASGEPLVQCTSERMSAADHKLLASTVGQVCDPGLTYDLQDIKPIYETTDLACGGVMYKQCTLSDGTAGMCYPARMQPVSCQLDPGYQAMRRMQIERGVGSRCDPKVEAWLGCEA